MEREKLYHFRNYMRVTNHQTATLQQTRSHPQVETSRLIRQEDQAIVAKSHRRMANMTI
jgi:hypothetical protein